MRPVAAAVGAELLQFEPVRVVTPVLPGDVVTVLALRTGQGDLGPDVGGSHDGVPFSGMGSTDRPTVRTSTRPNHRALFPAAGYPDGQQPAAGRDSRPPTAAPAGPRTSGPGPDRGE